ncbi:mitochondrial fission regulator 2-like isoform X2 [Sinocyclocheilus anshuiensis]|uniref:mitochondrial fission regulator 2-like isoform X1 n=1 Tax=Sinocyclocheilus anshuiensis TaxID=1608454 RepID=UPI0007B7FF0D|nr:PREDICTED: mitochondrial fission regulator 2-like isoform X1 [Sinocyclocheilus anshuiensis]XP_016359330.1 PREDICTED: mitochondrial fission regulator 2-like isoform X1 [Sinocyclocheilus anshuiensis]XP_016359331.1 PREDICTED: mitochondrial fission regulator 2-like isoform X2 [Sinocyclocheilus anshuiensis]
MSLLEDIADLLRCVLEYFGVPADMLVPVWDSTYCGQYRSIVRMIGTNLPLSPQPRLRFQIPLQTFNRHGHIDVMVDTPAIPTLADVLWLVEDEGDSHTKFRNVVPLRKAFEIPSLGSEHSLSVSVPAQRGGRALGQGTQPEALQKISALEEELQRLRAQIAMIVSAPAGPSVLPADPGTPCSTPLPVPVLTSTPVCPPPPPPPPLPPLAMGSCVEVSVSDVIRQRQSAKREKLAQCGPSAGTVAAALPSMLEVLKDMNQVKLRSVERSPGGTPVRRRRSKGLAFSSDPAALIAEALKRKFAHKQRDDSFGKENCSAEPSPFSSPDTPRILPHSRRSQGRIHL